MAKEKHYTSAMIKGYMAQLQGNINTPTQGDVEVPFKTANAIMGILKQAHAFEKELEGPRTMRRERPGMQDFVKTFPTKQKGTRK